MRLVPLSLVVAVASGCMATAPPPLAPERAEPPVVTVETPAAVPIRIEPQPVEGPPPTPPPTPERRIATRSVFEQDRVAVWTLENGLTVVYAWDDSARAYASRVSYVGPPVEPARALVLGGARTAAVDGGERLDDVLAGAAETVARVGASGARVFLHGPLGPEWVEPAVAAVLGTVAAGRPLAAPAPADRPGIDVRWDDLPALAVAATVVHERAPGASLVYDSAAGRASLGPNVPASALAPVSDAAARETSGALSVRADASAPALLFALDALFQLPGRFTPGRPVSEARDLRERVGRVPPGRVNALLSRLARASS